MLLLYKKYLYVYQLYTIEILCLNYIYIDENILVKHKFYKAKFKRTNIIYSYIISNNI